MTHISKYSLPMLDLPSLENKITRMFKLNRMHNKKGSVGMGYAIEKPDDTLCMCG